MYYGFDPDTKRCRWSTEYKPSAEDSVIIYSEEKHDIATISYEENDDGLAIIEVGLPEEVLEFQYGNGKQSLLNEASTTISVISDEIELVGDLSKEDDLAAWKEYRINLFNTVYPDDFPAKPSS